MGIYARTINLSCPFFFATAQKYLSFFPLFVFAALLDKNAFVVMNIAATDFELIDFRPRTTNVKLMVVNEDNWRRHRGGCGLVVILRELSLLHPSAVSFSLGHLTWLDRFLRIANLWWMRVSNKTKMRESQKNVVEIIEYAVCMGETKRKTYLLTYDKKSISEKIPRSASLLFCSSKSFFFCFFFPLLCS